MVLIDMDKPKSCLDCPFLINGGDCVLLPMVYRIETFEQQYERCPLKKVQE